MRIIGIDPGLANTGWGIVDLEGELNGNGHSINNLTINDIINMMVKHLNLLIEDKNEHTAILEFRNHLMYYFKYLPNSKETKVKLVQAKTKDEVLNILDEYKENVDNLDIN